MFPVYSLYHIPLWWRCLSKHVGEESGVSLLLVGHEADELLVFRGDSGCIEVRLGEGSETVVEQVELDPLLVKAKGNAGTTC